MGCWGTKIADDDAVLDVYETYVELFVGGTDPVAVREQLVADYAEALDDPDDGPAFWLGLAKGQHECGTLENDVLQWLEEYVASGRDRERWPQDAEEGLLRSRQKHLNAFVESLRTPRVRPRMPRKPRRNSVALPYEPGDCLAVRLSDGEYGAALVLNWDHGRRCGQNLVGLLNYKAPEKPSREVFERRDWLTDEIPYVGKLPFIAECFAKDHAKHADALERVDHIDPGEDDPFNGKTWLEWDLAAWIEDRLGQDPENGRPTRT